MPFQQVSKRFTRCAPVETLYPRFGSRAFFFNAKVQRKIVFLCVFIGDSSHSPKLATFMRSDSETKALHAVDSLRSCNLAFEY
jgi:hypothetical protein